MALVAYMEYKLWHKARHPHITVLPFRCFSLGSPESLVPGFWVD